MKSISIFACALLLISIDAFQSPVFPSRSYSRPSLVGKLPAATARVLRDDKRDTSFLLDEFRTANGEVVNPYKILKVSREADKFEIRQAYRKLSRRYHPDGVRHRSILPGNW